MILPLLDYGDIAWGDKNNKTLHKVAKSILDKAKHSSTRGNEQTWLASAIEKVMTTPSPFVFKCMHGLIDWEFN